MAVPKPKLAPPADDFWELPPEDQPAVFDDRRFREFVRLPGVVVHTRHPNTPAEPFVPTSHVTPGSMSVEDLLDLLDRRDGDDSLPGGSDRR